MRAITQEMLEASIIDMRLKNTNLKLQLHLPEPSELQNATNYICNGQLLLQLSYA